MFGKVIVTITGFFAAGAVLMALAHSLRGIPFYQRIEDWVKYVVYLVIVISLIGIAWAGPLATAIFLALLAVTGSFELYRNLPGREWKWLAGSILFGLGVAVCLAHVMLGAIDGGTSLFIFMLLLICVTDAYSQLWGKLIGRRKLCPKLSPGKTCEGFAGGVLTAVSTVFLIGFLVPSFTSRQLISIALITALSATVGDLLFSLIKRRLGIKDFSGLLPGHGGILDRFDSLIATAPIFYWTSRLWLN